MRLKIVGIFLSALICTATLSSCSLLKAFDTKEGRYIIDTEEFYDMLEKKAVQYMKNKYNIDCSMITYELGMDYKRPLKEQMYFAVSMKLEGVSEKPDGYEPLKYTNEKPENEDHAFYVYIDNSTYEVTGDQYMWYLIYPSLNQIIEDNIEKYAPCKAAVTYRFICSDYYGTGINGSFYFSADNEIIESSEQIKEYLESTKGVIEFCILQSDDLIIENWNNFVERLRMCGLNYKYNIATVNKENFEIVLQNKSIHGIKYNDIVEIGKELDGSFTFDMYKVLGAAI